ncbi:uncharacterized protein LOC143912361 [Arctopsyche grandis]|uniref:uncharacterized protein LOC143912361 n=1 Tax=Arctopsyche grandis TaxID=121162 RepID=UPI00406D89E3
MKVKTSCIYENLLMYYTMKFNQRMSNSLLELLNKTNILGLPTILGAPLLQKQFSRGASGRQKELVSKRSFSWSSGTIEERNARTGDSAGAGEGRGGGGRARAVGVESVVARGERRSGGSGSGSGRPTAGHVGRLGRESRRANMMNINTLLRAAEYIEKLDGERPPCRPCRPPSLSFSLPSRCASDADHGYASSLPLPLPLALALPLALTLPDNNFKRNKNKKSLGSRTTHNELEKNRRAHLRTCLEKLKDMVPLGPEASKHTTLGLLTKAKRYIKNLEERDKRHLQHREQLAREHRYLQRRLDQLRPESRGAGRRPLRRRPEENQQVLQQQHQLPQNQFQHALALSLTSRRSLSECSSASASSGTASRCGMPDSEPASISESDEVDVIGYTSNQSDTDDHSSIQSGSGDSGVALSASRLSLAHMEI